MHCVLPVNGGVVLCGMATHENQHLYVAAHYDRANRSVRTIPFGIADRSVEWATYPDLHSVVLRTQARSPALATDLAIESKTLELTTRSAGAVVRDRRDRAGAKQLIIEAGTWKMRDETAATLNLKDNSFRVIAPPADSWNVMTPTEDGKPLLAGTIVSQAQLAGDVLAMAITKGSETELRLYRGPDPTALGVVPLHGNPKLFTLSHDGRKLAWLRSKREVALADTDRLPHVVEKFAHAALHGQFEADCDIAPFTLEIRIGGYQHEIGVRDGELWHRYSDRKNKRTVPSIYRAQPLPSGYDRTRFQVVTGLQESIYRLIFDRFRQLLLLNSTNDLLVVLLVRRDKIAAWTPAGGFWGSPDLIGGAPTPGADKAIAEAIRPDWRSP